MAQQNLPVNGVVVFQGFSSGTTSLGSQPIGGGTTIWLPNSVPVGVGQVMTVQNLSGPNNSIITLGWSTPAAAVSSINLSQITQSGATINQVIEWNGTAWAPGTISSGVTSVFGRSGVVVAATNDYNFNQLAGSLAVSQINSKVGNGNAVQLTNTGQTIVSGDVLTYDTNGNVQDSGTLLSSLVPVYSTDTNKQAIRIKPSGAIGTFTPSESIAASLIVYGDGTNSNAIIQTQNGDGYFWIDPNGAITTQTLTTATGPAMLIMQPADQPALVAKLTAGASTHNAFEAWGISAVAPSFAVDPAGHLKVNTDIAGTVSITVGTSNTVTFNTPYGSAPVVVIVPTSNISPIVSYWVDNITTNGFQVNTSSGVSGTVTFNYIVMGN